VVRAFDSSDKVFLEPTPGSILLAQVLVVVNDLGVPHNYLLQEPPTSEVLILDADLQAV
jgi:hypothetical protein